MKKTAFKGWAAGVAFVVATLVIYGLGVRDGYKEGKRDGINATIQHMEQLSAYEMQRQGDAAEAGDKR